MKSFSRRDFLRSTAAAVALMCVPRPLRAAGPDRRVRCTVLRRECYADLQGLLLDDPETGPCSRFVTGQTLTLSLASCPAGFCERAWRAIADAVSAGGCSSPAVVSCPDGTRPVIFRIDPL